MGLLDFLRRRVRASDEGGHMGYYPLEEPYASAWASGEWTEGGYSDEVRYRSGTVQDFTADENARDLRGIYKSEGGPVRRTAQRWLPEHSKWWWAKRSLQAFFTLFLFLFAWLAWTAPLGKSLEPIAPPQITLLAADGTPIARNGAIMDDPVDVSKLPDHVTEAFLAIEDRRFYSHWGVDPRGLGRAMWSNVSGGQMQGGSTITQQLAKFTFLTPERSMTRKAREMLIAFWLETWLTKDEILERYLSNAYFGDNVYGLRAASLHFFLRRPENLKLEQAAMLAGLVQAPSRYNPTRHFERAEKRRKIVVEAMVAAGYLTREQADAMPRPVLDVHETNDLPTGTYFADWALPGARRKYEGGYASLKYTTTLDTRLQNIASKVIARAPLGTAQVALVAMRPDGEVVAMIGGRDYRESSFNRATMARRQPGSTFKLFVWLAALEAGMKPGDPVDNSPIESGSYRPKNSGGNYSDFLTLEDAFARSSNVAAVRLFGDVGDEAVIDVARDLGIRSPIPKGDPSVALGSATMTLLELTAAYAGIAGNSFPIVPRAVQAEEEGWFNRIWEGKRSLPTSVHTDMEQMLRAAINRGTGRAATLAGPNFGKTGTSQGNRDALFVGYAKGRDKTGADDLVVGVWIGNDKDSPLNGISGGGLPARIWRDFMSAALGAQGKPAPAARANPGGAVKPLDVPELDDIPLDENGSRMRFEDGNSVTIDTEIENVPLEIRLDQDGLSVESGQGRSQDREREPERIRR